MRILPLPEASWSRRDFLGAGAAGAAYLTLGGFPAGAADDELAGKTLNLVLRYRTDPDRIARALPPGLEPDDVAEVTVDWSALEQRIAWFGTMDRARAAARKTGRPILLVSGAPACRAVPGVW